jgi:hypothetical protein
MEAQNPIDPLTMEPAMRASTAGQEDHSDPSVFTGGPADPPSDTGEPPLEQRGSDHPGIDDAVLLQERP